MPFSDYSATPALNVTIGGINIAENCPAPNMNDAVRQLMADAKSFSLTVPSTAGLMPIAGGAFTGNITRSGAGGYFYHAGATQAAAPVYTQTLATALPASPAEGTVVLQY